MKNKRTKKYDILSAGELLIDFISTDFAETLEDVTTFKRILGGSPANMVMNMTRLGNKTVLVATLGADDMGDYLEGAVQRIGVNCQYVRRSEHPTTLILVTRSREVSNFQPYRGADFNILASQFPDDVLREVRLFHTTCFALSKEPARTSILQAAEKAHLAGAQLSIDANYAGKIWPDREEAELVVARYASMGALIKVSEVDWERLYGTEADPLEVIHHFLSLGAKSVCLTLGSDGCWVGDKEGRIFLPSRPVEVKDTTGAGDAFWSGFLTAWLDHKDKEQCAKAGRRMAELKLGHFGPLPDAVDRKELVK